MEAVLAVVTANSTGGSVQMDAGGQSDWQTFWESDEQDYLGDDGRSLRATVASYIDRKE